MKERNSSNTPAVSYTRGSDLSGSLEGAGGIGGLLGRSHGYASTNGNWYIHNCYHADGNGNVTYLVNSSQTLAASYKYDPYGNTVSQGGSLYYANVYRFSSKELHPSSGLYYYGYRFYSPSLQRWVNRDPIQERGGVNLYQFCQNNALAYVDLLGLLGKGRPPGWQPPTVVHSPRGKESYCPPKPPCLGHNNLPGGIWDGQGGKFDYASLDEGETRPYPGGRPDLHFLPLSWANDDAERAIFGPPPCDKRAFEQAMHEGQDYFSHRVPRPDLRHPVLPFIKGYPGCEWDPDNFEFGHLWWLDAPDRNPAAWDDAKGWTSYWVGQWEKYCGTSNQ